MIEFARDIFFMFLRSSCSGMLARMLFLLHFISLFCYTHAFYCSKLALNFGKIQNRLALNLEKAPYGDIIPYLSEHINFSDQILYLGCKNDMALQLVKEEYGIKKTGFMLIIDSDKNALDEVEAVALADPIIKNHVDSGKVKFAHVDYANMAEVCKQSCVDAIVDYGGIDSLLVSDSKDSLEKTKSCIQHLQNAVRLGNILVSISRSENEVFKVPFESGYGWIQELDGEPGELSAWYRGKSNIAATKSNFKQLGLKMFVYTNTDNC